MIDTHTHLYLPVFEDGGAEAVSRALEAGISHMVFPNTDLESLPLIRNLHARFPEVTSMAAGLHPTDAGDDWEEVVDVFEEELRSGDYKAVGEVGIDLYWDKTRLPLQQDVFERQLRMAESFSLPVIIHSRDAFPQTLECIDKVKPTVPLIFHSFTGSRADVEAIRNSADAYFGINGVVTYKNAGALREALSLIGKDRLLLETDSPYLTPVPHRGKRNESSYLHFICNAVAAQLGASPGEVSDFTDANASRLFNL